MIAIFFSGVDMVIALADIILFVTAFVSLTYGTRIAWQFGRICKLKNDGKQLSEKIRGYIPIAAFVYFIGFAITAKYFYKAVYGRNFEELGTFYLIFIPLIISLLSSLAVAWVAMPKRRKISHDSHCAETLDDLAENS